MFKVSAVDKEGNPVVMARLAHRRMNADGLGTTEEIEEKTEIEFATRQAAEDAAEQFRSAVGIAEVRVSDADESGGDEGTAAEEGEQDHGDKPGEDQNVVNEAAVPVVEQVEPHPKGKGLAR